LHILDGGDMKRLFGWLSVIVICALFSPGFVMAQNATLLTYGDSASGALAEGAPLSFYMFQGSENDVITASVIGVSRGMYPTLTLLGPGQALLQNSESDVFQPGARAATINYRLSETGTYSLLVGGTPGDYLLTLNARPAVAVAPLALYAPVQGEPVAEAPSQTFAVNADPARPLSIEVAGSQSPSNFVLELRDPDGRLVAILGGGMQSACLAIPAGEGQYELTIGAFDPLVEETFTVTLRQAERSEERRGGKECKSR